MSHFKYLLYYIIIPHKTLHIIGCIKYTVYALRGKECLLVLTLLQVLSILSVATP